MVSAEHPLGTREYMEKLFADRHSGTVAIMQHFAWSHLPDRLQLISRPCADLAIVLVCTLPDGPELTAGLRKLLEAKDCFVRAAV
jgi:hypothetical protein